MSLNDPKINGPEQEPVLLDFSDATTQPHSRLGELNRALDLAVRESLATKIERGMARELPSSADYVLSSVESSILGTIVSEGEDPSRVKLGLPTSKSVSQSGVDLAFNVIGLARDRGEKPVPLAESLAGSLLKDPSVDKTENIGPFVNIELDFRSLAPSILAQVQELGDDYGCQRDGDPEVVIVDYSSPNVAKNMTVGHLRSTVIGQSVVNLEEALGNIPFGINHIGDWGTQFGNIIYEYQKELRERKDEFLAELEADPTATLMRIYRAFNERKATDPEAVDEARNIFLRLEQGEPELVDLWDKFREWSLRDFGPVYARLGVDFDAIQGESFYEDKMDEVVKEGTQKGVLVSNEEGAIVFPSQALVDPNTGKTNTQIMRNQNGDPRDEVILKPSGGTVYLTRDLAAILYRARDLGAKRVLYVIGKEQKGHCLELFAMADQLGYLALGQARHVSFGHLNIDGRKMMARAGKVVLLKDLLDEAGMLAQLGVDQRAQQAQSAENPQTDLIEAIGVGSIIFNDLRHDREKDIEFNPDLARSMKEGGSVYIQYTNSRLASVLEKAGPVGSVEELPPDIKPEERRVLLEIALFPKVIKEAAEGSNPHVVANYLSDFCRTVNDMYHNLSVANADTQQEKVLRANILMAAKQVIVNASRIVQLRLPERM